MAYGLRLYARAREGCKLRFNDERRYITQQTTCLPDSLVAWSTPPAAGRAALGLKLNETEGRSLATHHPEVVLISSVIQTGDIIPVEEAGLRPDHFHAYRTVWEWVTSYVARYHRVPSKPVFRKAQSDFKLLKAQDVEWAIEEVKHNHIKQELARVVTDSVDLIKRDDVEGALQVLIPVVSKLERDFDGGKHIDAINDLDDILHEVSMRTERDDDLPGIPTGFDTLDDVVGGMQPSHYWVIGARLGNGKSWTMTAMAVEAALAGKTVLFHTLEMSRHQLSLRAHTFLGRRFGRSFTNWQLSNGTGLDLKEYRDFLEDLPAAVDGQLHFVDRSRGAISPFTVASNVERFDPDVVFIDYIQRMSGADGKTSTDWEALGQLSGELQALSKEAAIPVVVASQVNREGESGRRPPSADKLSRSDSIGQDPDVIVTQRQWTKRTVQMLLAKHRHGSAGQLWWSIFDPDKGIFKECTYDQAMDYQLEDEDEEED